MRQLLFFLTFMRFNTYSNWQHWTTLQFFLSPDLRIFLHLDGFCLAPCNHLPLLCNHRATSRNNQSWISEVLRSYFLDPAGKKVWPQNIQSQSACCCTDSTYFCMVIKHARNWQITEQKSNLYVGGGTLHVDDKSRISGLLPCIVTDCQEKCWKQLRGHVALCATLKPQKLQLQFFKPKEREAASLSLQIQKKGEELSLQWIICGFQVNF